MAFNWVPVGSPASGLAAVGDAAVADAPVGCDVPVDGVEEHPVASSPSAAAVAAIVMKRIEVS
jgi:hypothetical protein